MNDLVPANETDRDARANVQIQFLRSLRKDLKKRVKEQPEWVIESLDKTHILSMMAAKMKMHEIVKEAQYTIIEMKRQLALRYSPGSGKRGKESLESFDIPNATANRWRKIAALPIEMYKRALKLNDIPSEATVVREYNRMRTIQKFLDEKRMSTTDILSDFMKRGLDLYQVKEELGLIKEPVIELEDDDEDIDIEPSVMDALEEFVQNGDRALQLVKDLRVIVKHEAMSKAMVMLVKKGVSKFIQATGQLKEIYQQVKENIDDS